MYYRTVRGQITELTRESITQSHPTPKERKSTPIKSEAGTTRNEWLMLSYWDTLACNSSCLLSLPPFQLCFPYPGSNLFSYSFWTLQLGQKVWIQHLITADIIFLNNTWLTYPWICCSQVLFVRKSISPVASRPPIRYSHPSTSELILLL